MNKRVPAGREVGPDPTKPLSDAALAVERARPRDKPIAPRSDTRPVINRARVLPQVPPRAQKRYPLDVHHPRRTQGSDPRA